jgi:hypothetical protein
VWARAQTAARPPPFTKILLSKLLVLTDRKTRMDYFKQQADFFKTEGQKDVFAEFSTIINGKQTTLFTSFINQSFVSRLISPQT